MGLPSLGPSPGHRKNPSHTISITRSTSHYLAALQDITLAESNDVLILTEKNYSPVIYFPYKDVKIELMEPSASKTHCPFKGEAYYYSMGIKNRRKDVAWYYPNTYEEVTEIAGFIAFYTDLVEINEII